ncbi:type II toxin-antitoxin system YafQ family toxin [Pseudostreptobacillus sp.]
MKYEVKFTTQFKKDLKLAKKQNKDIEKLFKVVELLANGEKLDFKYKDHDLSGNYKGTRECHIEPDWLLVYEYQNDVLVLMLYRLGSYSELFKK